MERKIPVGRTGGGAIDRVIYRDEGESEANVYFIPIAIANGPVESLSDRMRNASLEDNFSENLDHVRPYWIMVELI